MHRNKGSVDDAGVPTASAVLTFLTGNNNNIFTKPFYFFVLAVCHRFLLKLTTKQLRESMFRSVVDPRGFTEGLILTYLKQSGVTSLSVGVRG